MALCIFGPFGHSRSVSLCSQFLQSLGSPRAQDACQISLPRDLLCHSGTERADLNITPKPPPRAVSAVLVHECRCIGGGPTAAPGSLSYDADACIHPCAALKAASSKVNGDAAFHSNE